MLFRSSPHRFSWFDMEQVGSGEGTQWEGYGLYFTSKKEIGDWYREKEEKCRGLGAAYNIDGTVYVYNEPHATWEYIDEDDEYQSLDSNSLSAFLSEYDEDNPDAAFEYLRENEDEYDKDDLENTLDYLKDAKIESTYAGQVYKVEIPEDHELMHRDKPVGQQEPQIQDAVKRLMEDMGEDSDRREIGRASCRERV